MIEAKYQLLPRRAKKPDGSKSKWTKATFFSNYSRIEIDPDRQKIFQYSFLLPEHIPDDSGLYESAIIQSRKTLKDKCGFLHHRGQMFWGTTKLEAPFTQQCQLEVQGAKEQLEAIIHPTKEINMKDLDCEETKAVYLQILNSNLKSALKDKGMMQVGKLGQFYPASQTMEYLPDMDDIGLRILRGFRFTLVPLNIGTSLQIDVCTRILQEKNLLEIFDNCLNASVAEAYTGNTIITRYGTWRTYSIVKVDFSLNPMSTFFNDKKGVEMTYKDYYKQAYGKEIGNTRQPLIKVVGRYNKVKENGVMKRIPEYIYLVPELCSLTGLTQEQVQSHKNMRDIAVYTQLTPSQRTEQCALMIERINETKCMIRILSPILVDGYILPMPKIQYQSALYPDESGEIRNKGALKDQHEFSKWLFVSSGSSRQYRNDYVLCEEICQTLSKAGQRYRVSFKKPVNLSVKGKNVNAWKTQINAYIQGLKNTEKPEIIVVVFQNKEDSLYGELKGFITNQIQIPSQFLISRKITGKSALSVASKVIIQMHAKVGKTPWLVMKGHEYFNKRRIMYGALSISKNKQGYTLAFVGSINDDCTLVYSDVKVRLQDKEEIKVEVMQEMFINWARSYYRQSGRKDVPDTIILYREGLSDIQAKQQLPRSELPALENMVKVIGQKTSRPNYNPEIICVIVSKKINTRLFSMARSSQSPSKFQPKVYNPESGSVVIEPFSIGDSYDFHLAAQKVTQGTCTPTLFKVAYDTSKMPQQALIRFTFEQCFNYYNWQGAVRVPACLQCADKLAKLFGQSIKAPLVQSPLTNKPFFL